MSTTELAPAVDFDETCLRGLAQYDKDYLDLTQSLNSTPWIYTSRVSYSFGDVARRWTPFPVKLPTVTATPARKDCACSDPNRITATTYRQPIHSLTCW